MIWLIIILIVVCFVVGLDAFLWGFLILSLAVIVWVLATEGDKKEAAEEEKRKEKEANEARRKANEARKRAYDVKKAEILIHYGTPEKTIAIEEYDVDQEIMVFGKIRKLLLLGKEISFDDILSCTFMDDYQIEKGDVAYQSEVTTNNKNMVSRAIVGKVLSGGAGAIIGGSTASRDILTTAIQENDTIIHDYTVIININSLENPIIDIYLGEDEKILNEIVGLMNVVIVQSKR